MLASQALNTEADDAHLIYNFTKGIMFFATPHMGSAVSKHTRAQILKKIAKVAFTEAPPKIESALEQHSDELADLADDFQKTSLWTRRELVIYTYFENRTDARLGDVVGKGNPRTKTLLYTNELLGCRRGVGPNWL